jgi:hypothetical protein
MEATASVAALAEEEKRSRIRPASEANEGAIHTCNLDQYVWL